MLFIAYTFNGHVHVFAGRVKIVSVSSYRTSTTMKYFCPLVKSKNGIIQKVKDCYHMKSSSRMRFRVNLYMVWCWSRGVKEL